MVCGFMDIKEYVQRVGSSARDAAGTIAKASNSTKNHALECIAKELEIGRDGLLKANSLDLMKAGEQNLDSALLDRLELTDDRVNGMLEGLHQVIKLDDPVGAVTEIGTRPSGIRLSKMRVPLGVVGIIYESRPNVTIDAASLCLKAGNACILRGGSESINSNKAIASCIDSGLAKAGLPKSSIQVIAITDRKAVGELITLTDYIDVIVPRGGKSLIARIAEESRVPIIKHLDGNCHLYIDAEADPEMAITLAINSKTHRYGVCNAMESLLVARSISDQLLPRLCNAMLTKEVELRGCEMTLGIASSVLPASDSDWSKEYLAPILSIKVVENIDEAISHINKFGSQHTDAIVTQNIENARRFIEEVDSSSVMVNASTRFADGFEYGLGAEVGISTDKIHARGPVGLEGLTCQKWVVHGDGQIRQ